MRKIICVILILFFAILLAFAGYQIYQEYAERKESVDTYTDLEEFVSFPEEQPDTLPKETDSSESGEMNIDPVGPTIDFDGLKDINDDCVGWIYIEDTVINYPVVQGTDNSFYLKHLFNGKWNSSGCIFLDSRVTYDLSDRHSIIYGHHMKDGSMFSGLTRYKEQQYFDEHSEALYITSDRTYKITFFAGYVASVGDPAWNVSFGSDDEFEAWIKDTKARSWIKSDLSPAVTDNILSLSTCSYEFSNARFVLYGFFNTDGERGL